MAGAGPIRANAALNLCTPYPRDMRHAMDAYTGAFVGDTVWLSRFSIKPPKKIDAQALKHVALGMILVPIPFLCKRRPSLSPSKWAPPGESRVTVTAASPRRSRRPDAMCAAQGASRGMELQRASPPI